jgi:hypothetical protein
MKKAILAAILLSFLPAVAHTQSPSANTLPVTVENFERAESDNYLAVNAKESGLGKLTHRRVLASIDNQTVIRLNRAKLNCRDVLSTHTCTVSRPATLEHGSIANDR